MSKEPEKSSGPEAQQASGRMPATDAEKPSAFAQRPAPVAPQAPRAQAAPQATAEPPPPPEFGPDTPYTASDAIVPGGCYGQNTKRRGSKDFGGELVNAHGVVLATFEDDQENTGNPKDGKLTDEGKKFLEAMKAHKEG